jgi:hypothetical protein
MEKSGGGRAGFDAVGRAYVRFALDNPTLVPHDDDDAAGGRLSSTMPARAGQ